MNTVVTSRNVYEKLHEEHQALREKLGRIPETLTGVRPSPAEIRRLLQEFDQSLSFHFSNEEEEGGFFADISNHSPELAGRAGKLRAEHHELRRAAVELCRFATSGSPSLPWWRELASRCHAFSRQLMQHESEENRLLQQTYRQDLGGRRLSLAGS